MIPFYLLQNVVFSDLKRHQLQCLNWEYLHSSNWSSNFVSIQAMKHAFLIALKESWNRVNEIIKQFHDHLIHLNWLKRESDYRSKEAENIMKIPNFFNGITICRLSHLNQISKNKIFESPEVYIWSHQRLTAPMLTTGVQIQG